MQGYNTLWLPGTDHAGIATQIVVERQLEQQGLARSKMSREEFVERCGIGRRIQGHDPRADEAARRLVRLGRTYFTMDERLSRVVVETFVRLYEQGLIYRGQRLVNWDPALQTAVSDLEVENEEEEGRIWEIRYPAPTTARRGGRDDPPRDDARRRRGRGQPGRSALPGENRHAVVLPLTGRTIPVIADSYVDPQFGTGCVKITPAHDFNDFAIAQRHA